jgi:hypothetical protein
MKEFLRHQLREIVTGTQRSLQQTLEAVFTSPNHGIDTSTTPTPHDNPQPSVLRNQAAF